MAASPHPLAPHHLPFFITAPGQTDVLMVAMLVILLVVVLIIGNLYFQLHSLPERIAHRKHSGQMQLVAVLSLLALFTHNNIFWVAALLIVFVRLPDFSSPMNSIAQSLQKLAAGSEPPAVSAPSLPAPPTEPSVTVVQEPRGDVPGKRARAMLELLFCALFTILPDYLYRRYVQGKRVGREIALYTVWYELRWGITACLVLTVSLLTTIFYFHPSTHSAIALYRTVSILPETSGRVAEVFVKLDDDVAAGAPLFRLDSSAQQAALDTARRRIDEIDAQTAVAKTEVAAADGLIRQVQGSLNLALDELATKTELQQRQSGTVAVREIERLQRSVDGMEGAMAAAVANKTTIQARISTLLPAQKASAEAALRQAQAEMDKTTVYASISGKVQQFTLRPGEIVNPVLRPAGILVPTRDRMALLAGFNQIEADVMKVGMLGEVTCAAKPFTIIPVVIESVQTVIAAGQLRMTDQLVDIGEVAKSGTITVYMLPLYPDGFEGIPLGSHCIANAYTSNHERLAAEDLSTPTFLFLHAVDAVAMVHAIILRLQALLLPVTTLVLGGH